MGGDRRDAYTFLGGRPEGKRSLTRKWEDNIKMFKKWNE